jgi:hypothetical protein
MDSCMVQQLSGAGRLTNPFLPQVHARNIVARLPCLAVALSPLGQYPEASALFLLQSECEIIAVEPALS